MKKLMKSKKGAFPLIPIVWLVGLVLVGIPIFGTWLKLMFTPASSGFSPVWIIVGGFVLLLLLRRK